MFLLISKSDSLLAGIIERERIPVVHSNKVTQIDGALAAYATHRAHVWHIHENLIGNTDLTLPLLTRTTIERTISHLSNRIVGVSETLLRQGYPYLWKSVQAIVVYNGLDLNLFQPNSQAKKQLSDELGFNANMPVVAIIGGLRKVKNQPIFLKAAALMKSKAIFLIIGEGPEREHLQQMAMTLGIGSAVLFLEERDDIARIMPAMNLLAVSSRSEAFPNTVIKAMAAGIPVVATRCGGISESVLDGKTGLLVDVNAAEAMTLAMDKLLQNPELAAQYGRAGRERAANLFLGWIYTYRA
ncbi:MAG: glycosyltransferase [Methylobacter sp.]|uniref:glycosyltransferase n=1 Tax=Methylobacter sp. TaxID=2051955 RepID=UPI00258D948E|nr:glycosyltransferase [Methylobacter sp.]MCL7421338.1 glycosyltransferase [Methylobacter sp.]